MQLDLSDIIARAVVLLISLPFHEFAHSYTAVKLGDPTSRDDGRLTLNPFAHLSLLGSAALLLLGFGWAKPVMVDPRYFKSPKRDMAIVSLAGPLANILMATAAMIIVKIMFYAIPSNTLTDAVFLVFRLIVVINTQLAVFNLLPIPPLDGSKILGFLLPDNIYAIFIRYERYVMFALLLLLWFNILDTPLIFLSRALMSFIDLLTYPVGYVHGLIFG